MFKINENLKKANPIFECINDEIVLRKEGQLFRLNSCLYSNYIWVDRVGEEMSRKHIIIINKIINRYKADYPSVKVLLTARNDQKQKVSNIDEANIFFFGSPEIANDYAFRVRNAIYGLDGLQAEIEPFDSVKSYKPLSWAEAACCCLNTIIDDQWQKSKEKIINDLSLFELIEDSKISLEQ